MTITQRIQRTHPLDLVTAEEVERVRRVTAEAGLVAASTRFVYVGLHEPDKHDVLGHAAGQPDGTGAGVTVA